MLDAEYINYRVVGFDFADLDDLSAALGNFAFRVVVAGTIATVVSPPPAGLPQKAPPPAPPKLRITTTDVGVYIRDSYDFNGTQFLGFWNEKDGAVSGSNPLVGDAVSNDDFRKWRAKNGKGGDFLVYSDLQTTHLTSPDSFEV